MANPVVHFEIGSKDFDKARNFYTRVFDWKITDHAKMKYGMVEKADEGSIGGGITPLPEGAPPFVTFYIQVDDLKACLDRIEAEGGRMVVPPTPIPDIGHGAIFADPDGNHIGLIKEG